LERSKSFWATKRRYLGVEDLLWQCRQRSVWEQAVDVEFGLRADVYLPVGDGGHMGISAGIADSKCLTGVAGANQHGDTVAYGIVQRKGQGRRECEGGWAREFAAENFLVMGHRGSISSGHYPL